MASSDQKFGIVFEAQDKASAKIAELHAKLASLGGPELVKSQNEIKKLERQIDQLSGTTTKSHGVWSKFAQNIAVGTIAANVAMNAFNMLTRSVSGFFDSTISSAAESERVMMQLNATLERHGYVVSQNSKEVAAFATKMQQMTGIADEEYLQAVQQMIDRGASLSQAYRLVGAAADAAASRHVDLSATIKEFANAVGKESLVKLEKYGITIDTTRDFAGQLDNALLQLTANFGGAAADATDSYTVRVGALKGAISDFKEELGAKALPVLIEFIKTMQAFVEEFSRAVFGEQFLKEGEKVQVAGQGIIDTLKQAQANMTGWVNIVVGGAGIIGNAFQIVVGSIRTVLAPIVDLIVGTVQAVIGLGSAVGDVASGDFMGAWENVKGSFSDVTGAWSNAAESIQTEAGKTGQDIDDLVASFARLTAGIAEVTKPTTAVPTAIKGTKAVVDDKAKNAKAEAEANMRKAALKKLTDSIEFASDDITDSFDDDVTMLADNTLAQLSIVDDFAAGLSEGIQQRFGQGVANMINAIATGRGNIGEIFKQMAQDFMTYFIQKALMSLITSFIPGLGSILGGIFDTPVNDRMAAKQGADFAAWFERGAMAQFAGGNALAASFTRNSNRIAPTVMNSGGNGGGGMVYMNVTVTGNVLSDGYIEKTIKPRLQQLSTDGKASLSMKPEHRTGQRDVRFS